MTSESPTKRNAAPRSPLASPNKREKEQGLLTPDDSPVDDVFGALAWDDKTKPVVLRHNTSIGDCKLAVLDGQVHQNSLGNPSWETPRVALCRWIVT